MVFPFFLFRDEGGEKARGHDAGIGRVQTFRLVPGHVWRARSHGSHEVLSRRSGLRTHPFTDNAVDEPETGKRGGGGGQYQRHAKRGEVGDINGESMEERCERTDRGRLVIEALSWG